MRKSVHLVGHSPMYDADHFLHNTSCHSQPYYLFHTINCLELRREISLDVAVGTVTRLWARRFGFQLLVGSKPPE
jgi:hypothetical protein